jgi:ribonuclease P/MRP protein subunit RPP40
MKFNASKCEVMKIDHSHSTLEKFYKINGQVLKEVDKTKYLGIMISNDLSWTPQVQYVTGKANKVLGVIRRNFKECPQELREIAYFSMVRSILDHASAIWDPHLANNVTKVDQVQRRAARFVKHEYRIYNKEEQQYNSVTKMINELGCKDLADRRRNIRLSLFYKIINEDVNICTSDILKPASGRTRRSQGKNKFTELQTKTDDYKYSFYPRTITEWNSLPTSTVNAPSIETFKSHLQAKPLYRA